MKAIPVASALVAFVLSAALPAAAQELTECVAARLDQGSRPGACVAEGLSACDSEPSDMPAVAMLCYQKAQDGWGEGLAARMAEVRATASQQIAALTSVEVKYDLLGKLMQCDRLEELALIGEGDAQAIQRDKARCAAAATGLTFVRLLISAKDL
ncbi:hypothetical protein JYP51_01760 [Ponticoccus gilvus]|nr:hypothetical protein [Enemella evansiae]